MKGTEHEPDCSSDTRAARSARAHAAVHVRFAGAVDLDRASCHGRRRVESRAQPLPVRSAVRSTSADKASALQFAARMAWRKSRSSAPCAGCANTAPRCTSSRPGSARFPESMGLRFPPIAETHVLAIRLMENAGWLKIDTYLDSAKVADYDAVILPGGCWNPDFLRADKHAQDFTRDMHAAGKPTCGICHGPWVMVSARMLRGKKGDGRLEHPDRSRERRGRRGRRTLRGRRQPDHGALPLRPASHDQRAGETTRERGLTHRANGCSDGNRAGQATSAA